MEAAHKIPINVRVMSTFIPVFIRGDLLCNKCYTLDPNRTRDTTCAPRPLQHRHYCKGVSAKAEQNVP